MLFPSDALTLALILIIALAGIGIAVAAVTIKKRADREKRNIAAINAAIVDYFRKTGVDVAVGCTSLAGNGFYTAVIESEPMKRFRLSHIIEMTLRDHVRKTCALELEKVYWRFPLAAVQSQDVRQAEGVAPAANPDEYINEGLEHYKDLPKVEATELSWERFQEATTLERESKPAGEAQRQ